MRRCAHPTVTVKDFTENRRIDVVCDVCGQGWWGLPYPWRSRRGILHTPPKWVQRVVESCESLGMDTFNFMEHAPKSDASQRDTQPS